MAQTLGGGVLGAVCLLLLAVQGQGLQVCPSLSCPEPAGFFAHPTDCGSYVKCSSGDAVIKECSDGLHFHPVLRRCDYPHLAQCNITARLLKSGCSLQPRGLAIHGNLHAAHISDESSSSGKSQSSVECDCDCCLKPHDVCSKYYECDEKGGSPLVMECSDGLVFNPEIENCDFPINYQCPTKPPPVCDCDCRYPVENECNAFYDCRDGEPEKKYCPDGLFFNPETGVCGLLCPQTTTTITTPLPSTTTTTTTTPAANTTTKTTHPITTTTTTMTPAPNTTTTTTMTPSPNTTTTTTTTAAPNTTTTTTTNTEPSCDTSPSSPNTTTTTTTTPAPNTTTTTPALNTTTTTAMTPALNSTTTTTTPLTTAATTQPPYNTTFTPDTSTDMTTQRPSTTTAPTTTTTTPMPASSTTQSPFQCVDCSSGQQYFSHPTDCKKFIQCAPYGPQEMSCPPGTVWDQSSRICNHEAFTPCVTGSYVSPDGDCVHPPITTSTTTRRPSNTTTTPSGSDCDIVCPAPVGLFQHPQTCSEWIHCDHNIPYVKDCPSGLHFNTHLKVCDWPDKAGCTSKPDHSCEVPTLVPTTPPPNATVPTPNPVCDCQCCHKPAEDCTAYYYCDEDQSLSFHECSDGLVFHPDLSTCVYEDMYPECVTTEPPPVCLCDCFYPSEVCTSYYSCNNGEPVKLDCPDGLYWNQEKKTCDLPQFVNCTVAARRLRQ